MLGLRRSEGHSRTPHQGAGPARPLAWATRAGRGWPGGPAAPAPCIGDAGCQRAGTEHRRRWASSLKRARASCPRRRSCPASWPACRPWWAILGEVPRPSWPRGRPTRPPASFRPTTQSSRQPLRPAVPPRRAATLRACRPTPSWRHGCAPPVGHEGGRGEAVNLSHRSRWKSDHGCE